MYYFQGAHISHLVLDDARTTVERGISTLNRELISTRSNLNNATLNDLLLLRINLPVLLKCDPVYDRKLLEKVTCKYQQAKQKKEL